MKCSLCPVASACVGELRPIFCDRLAADPAWAEAIAYHSSISSPHPPPDADAPIPPTNRMFGPAYHRCPHRKPLPPELREGCGCIAWCELGRSEKPHHKVDPTDCGNCIRAGGWPGYSPEEHGTL